MEKRSEENTQTVSSWVEFTYNHWLNHYLSDGLTGSDAKRQALTQTLHKANLMEIEDWDKNTTPGEIADSLLKVVPEEIDWWLKIQRELRIFELNKHDERYRRVLGVKYELTRKLRRMKEEEKQQTHI